MADNTVVFILHNALILFQAKEQELGWLDAAAGDGDHGATMVRGLAAAVGAVDGQARTPALQGSAGDLLVCAGDAFADAAGGYLGTDDGVAPFRIADDGAVTITWHPTRRKIPVQAIAVEQTGDE